MDIVTTYWRKHHSNAEWGERRQCPVEEHTGCDMWTAIRSVRRMSLRTVSAGDRTELSGGQRPESVLDGGSIRAENQGQPGAEMLPHGSAEASAPTKPGEGINGEQYELGTLGQALCRWPKTADALVWPGKGQGVRPPEKSRVIPSQQGSG